MSNQSNLNILNFIQQLLHSSYDINMIQEIPNNNIYNKYTHFRYFYKGSEEIFEKQPIFFYESMPPQYNMLLH